MQRGICRILGDVVYSALKIIWRPPLILFVAQVLHLRTHRLSGMEEWLEDQRRVLVPATGWEIGSKEATDDRLGALPRVLGQERERSVVLQRELGQHLIFA